MAWRDIDIGAVSAYAVAVEQGYKGTEEQWAMDQAQAGVNGALAKQSADTAIAAAEAAQKALESLEPNTQQAIVGIQTEGRAQRDSVTSIGDAQNQRVLDTGSEQSRALDAQGATERQKVVAAGDEQVSRVTTVGDDAVESVTLEKTNAINGVQSTKNEAVSSVESAKMIAVEAIKSAESEAIQNIGTGVDDTLSISGKAADAKKTGDSISSLKDDVAAITPDDTVVDGKPWTSKKTVDSLCMPIEATGNPVQVYPVEGYPLGVKASWGPVQEGSGDPSPDNIRPITGRDSVSITIGNGMDSKTTDIALPETVYGGELDVETSSVLITHEMVVITGSEEIIEPSSKVYYAIFGYKKSDGTLNGCCTHYPYTNSNSVQSVFVNKAGAVMFYKLNDDYTLDEFKAYFAEQYAAGTPIQVLYKLAEPYTIQLTHQQIAALSGVNTIYTDADGVVVTGAEDLHHTITELKNAIISLGGNV